jgi:methionyl aminopeptidase
MLCAVCDVQGVEKMRASCKLAAQVLQHAGGIVKPGMTTDEIDQVVHDMIVAAGAYPSPLNYGKFPKSVCTSVNEVMCHGIPDKRCARPAGVVLQLTGASCVHTAAQADGLCLRMTACEH